MALLLLSLCLSVCTSHQQFQSQSQSQHLAWQIRPTVPPPAHCTHVHSVAHHVCFPCHCCCCRFAFAAFRLALSPACLCLFVCLSVRSLSYVAWMNISLGVFYIRKLSLTKNLQNSWMSQAKKRSWQNQRRCRCRSRSRRRCGLCTQYKIVNNFQLKVFERVELWTRLSLCLSLSLSLACQLQLVLAQLCKPLGQLVVCQLVLAAVLRQTTLAPGLSSCTSSSPSSGLTCPNMGPLNFSKMSYLISHLDVFIASASRAMLG